MKLMVLTGSLALALLPVASAQFNTTVPAPATLRLNTPPQSDPLDVARQMQEIRLRQQQAEIARQQAEAQRLSNEAAARGARAQPSLMPAAQLAPAGWFSGGLMNCRGWNAAPNVTRLALTVGLQEGALLGIAVGSGADTEKGEKLAQEWIPPSSTNEEVQHGLENLCAAPENATLPVGYLLQIFTLRVTGSPSSDIDVRLASYRKTVAEWK